jgi:hypothetical protein
MIKPVFNAKSLLVAGFDGTPLPINLYPNAHSPGQTVSVVWAMPVADAEQLAADILAAAKAVREAQAKPAEPKKERCRAPMDGLNLDRGLCQREKGHDGGHCLYDIDDKPGMSDNADHGPEVR